MSVEDVTIGTQRLICGTAEAVLPTLPDASVQLICVDPPYFNVKSSYLGEKVTWDKQWKTREDYLRWLQKLAVEWRRVLTSNGSLYCFASPQLAAYVEVMLGEVFQVLNHLVWVKHDGSGAGTGGHSKVCKEDLMSYFPQTERIIFCEPYGSNDQARDAAGYVEAQRALKTSLFSAPIAEAMAGTNTSAKEVTEAIGAYGTVNHGGAVSNWLQGYNIPTRAHYEAMRTFFNTKARQEYVYLRQEYEDLRRPFFLSPSVPYTDCFTFKTVPWAPGKHPCQKPLPLLRHLINVSSRPGDTVLDCCMGSGSTLEAAKQCGRKGIGIEMDNHWYNYAIRRLSQEELGFTIADAFAEQSVSPVCERYNQNEPVHNSDTTLLLPLQGGGHDQYLRSKDRGIAQF